MLIKYTKAVVLSAVAGMSLSAYALADMDSSNQLLEPSGRILLPEVMPTITFAEASELSAFNGGQEFDLNLAAQGEPIKVAPTCLVYIINVHGVDYIWFDVNSPYCSHFIKP